jgi:hypothetical protein
MDCLFADLSGLTFCDTASVFILVSNILNIYFHGSEYVFRSTSCHCFER